ncbi:MAG: hypothetical protein WAW42_19040, partial [Candidatus Competibacteraceae bacterium]
GLGCAVHCPAGLRRLAVAGRLARTFVGAALPSNPRWSVTPTERLRRPVLAFPPPMMTRGTSPFLGRAAGPLRAG